jgi:hypothetical protein
MQIDKFKTIIRTVIREELDYYFEKLSQQLNESAQQQTPRKKVLSNMQKSKKVSQGNPKLRSKFMQAISEGFDEQTLQGIENEGSTPSILDENNLNVLASTKGNRNVQAVAKALTRDYSQIIKKVDDIKSKKLI